MSRDKPLYTDIDWAADRGRGVAQLIADGGTLIAEFDAEAFADFLDGAAQTRDFLAGVDQAVTR